MTLICINSFHVLIGWSGRELAGAWPCWGDYRVPTRDYQASLLKSLQDTDEAAAYLTACLQESEEVFLLALRHVAKALGGDEQLTDLLASMDDQLVAARAERARKQGRLGATASTRLISDLLDPRD